MARKKAGKPKMSTTAKPKVKPIRLDLTEPDHDTLRIVAAKAKMSMSRFVKSLVMRAIEAERKGGR
jgi:hypothetical protein